MHDLERLSDLLIEFYEKLSSWEQAVVRDTSITLPQMHTLEILGQQSPLRMKELAAKMGVTTGTLTVNVDRLEKQGLVARIPHETDRRSILVGLTPAGAELFREHHDHHLHLTRELQAALSPEETEQFASILAKLTQAL
ncbi:MarR family winged helix-turn-helix transcriptional regulator [Desulfomicrobium escambiense]|uniref:MarR family winged helix-turn-helix transcriptional regulator n=1 Tax=Desulfomicrobium escambiense TaxID=29503 RepID=UPI0004237331|nr:MarR family transcriptional regulator [Desulfomicrobium escambiense]